MLTFNKLTPGEHLGTNVREFDQDVVAKWLDLFPGDKDFLPDLPPGMISVITMRAFLETVQPRPKGNIHGTQEFAVHKLPVLGDRIETDIFCTAKETRKNNNWAYFETKSHNQNGALLFVGSTGIIWGG